MSVDKDLMQLVDDKNVIMYDFVNKKNIGRSKMC